MLPSVHTSTISRSGGSSPAGAVPIGSTLKFTRCTGEKSASSRIALIGSASGSRFSAET